jgi:hypothetical protein
MSQRRFNETEVAEIFERATQHQASAVRQTTSAEGMTLVQLQEIGREVGIAPEALEQAARSIDLSDRETGRRFLGLPIGVGLTANIGRQLTDEEWQRLIVDLRETFDARGKVREEGAFRQWTNGNLQVLVEPSADGNQIRMRTFKEDSRLYIGMGLGLIALAVFVFAGKIVAGTDVPTILGKFIPLSFMGTGLVAFGALRLPGWARERRAQMESIVARLRSPR